jgi:uncharacterized protein (DUF1499 family)
MLGNKRELARVIEIRVASQCFQSDRAIHRPRIEKIVTEPLRDGLGDR